MVMTCGRRHLFSGDCLPEAAGAQQSCRAGDGRGYRSEETHASEGQLFGDDAGTRGVLMRLCGARGLSDRGVASAKSVYAPHDSRDNIPAVWAGEIAKSRWDLPVGSAADRLTPSCRGTRCRRRSRSTRGAGLRALSRRPR